MLLTLNTIIIFDRVVEMMEQ